MITRWEQETEFFDSKARNHVIEPLRPLLGIGCALRVLFLFFRKVMAAMLFGGLVLRRNRCDHIGQTRRTGYGHRYFLWSD